MIYGIIKITDDHKGEHYSIPTTYKPYAVVEISKVYKNGYEQIDRTFYDKDGRMKKQVHSGHHDRKKQHPYGKHGEHTHTYQWDNEGKLIGKKVKEFTNKDRVESSDILRS
ncbi:MAG: hypothetical protein RSB70_06465 [Clostridium sp.]